MSARKRIATVSHESNTEDEKIQPQHGYEFGGPIGAMSQIITVPIFVIAMVTCYETAGCEFKKVSCFYNCKKFQ